MKIITVIGARPQFIKAALLSREIKKDGQIREILVHTGQHYDTNMSQAFFDDLKLRRPEYNLGVGSFTGGMQTAKIMIALEPVLDREAPDGVLVYGDTNSTLAGALCAARMRIPVFHVEAGLRSFDKSMPEEINRVLTDHLSSLLFCPTRDSLLNLKAEGITRGVSFSGDIMYELAVKSASIAAKKSAILKRLGLQKGEYFLLTIHRQSNTDDPDNLKGILAAAMESPKKVVFPMHPGTRKMLEKYGLTPKASSRNIIVCEPVGYYDMVCLERNAAKILTDSGGVQKEAFFFGIPCITLRRVTEWKETLEGGWNTLAGADKNRILTALLAKRPSLRRKSYYGKADTSARIVKILKKWAVENGKD